MSDIEFGQNSSWTATSWLDWESDNGSYVFYMGEHDNAYESFMLKHWSDVFAYRMTDSNYVTFTEDSSNYYQTGWFHLAWVSDGNDLSLYINGVFKEKKSIADTTLTFSGIGRGYNNNYFFDGKIDDVRVYDEALSDSDIEQVYDGGSVGGGGSSSSNIYYYHYDGLGNVVALSDSAGDTVQFILRSSSFVDLRDKEWMLRRMERMSTLSMARWPLLILP